MLFLQEQFQMLRAAQADVLPISDLFQAAAGCLGVRMSWAQYSRLVSEELS
jgi:hypothetical protein